MKALEFQTRVTAGRSVLELPADVAAQMPEDRPVRVLILVDDEWAGAEEEAAWKRMAAEQFFKGDEEFDGLYDKP